MAGAGRTTTFQLAQAVGVAVAVAVVGQPATSASALPAYRTGWLLSAATLAAVTVLFLFFYPPDLEPR